jgi:hypothetical protein
LNQVFQRGVDQDTVILMAARASRTENQDAIDATIVGMLADPKEVYQITFCFQFIDVLVLFLIPFLTLIVRQKGSCWYSRGPFSAIQSNRQKNCFNLHRP